MEEAVRKVQEWLAAHENDLIEDTRAMLRIASLESEAQPNAPFGPGNREALDLALKLANEWGFTTKDLEGYGAWGEIGQGENMVLTMGHLDVVPVNESGWKHEPFGAEIDGEYIYARGACDDKGPTMASFYALRAIKECNIELPTRLRIFFGCNEESGFKCVERYRKTEEVPVLGVAPDSGWPLYYAEKGIANLFVSWPLAGGKLQLLQINGGQRPNIVIDKCDGAVRVDPSIRKEIEEKLADNWDRNISYVWEGDTLRVFAVGKAAHGATPFLGDSAATRLLRFFLSLAPTESKDYYEELFMATHCAGVGLGIHGSDDVSEDLTSNLGIISTKDGRVHGLFNVRRPVTWPASLLEEKVNKFFAITSNGGRLDSIDSSEPLYFPLDHVLTKTIVDVYRKETGDMKEPGTMGGGTYARAVPNCVSIGTGWDGDGPAHENDERIKVSHLLKMAKIYAHLFLRLAEEGAKIKQ